MQMVNHKCEENSNCYVVHIMFRDDGTGLGILVLKAKRDITLEDLQQGPVFLSFAYRGTFFRPAVPGEPIPKGFELICCGCGSNGICPRNLVRFERAVVDGVPVTRLTRPLAPAAEHQSQVLSVLIDSGPTEDTDENMELRLWKQAEADLRRLDRVDARLSRALDIVRAASNYKEKNGELLLTIKKRSGCCNTTRFLTRMEIVRSLTPWRFRLSRTKMAILISYDRIFELAYWMCKSVHLSRRQLASLASVRLPLSLYVQDLVLSSMAEIVPSTRKQYNLEQICHGCSTEVVLGSLSLSPCPTLRLQAGIP